MNKSISILFALLVSSMLIEMLNAQDVECTQGRFGRQRCRTVYRNSQPSGNQRLTKTIADQRNQINRQTKQINDLLELVESLQLQVQQLQRQTTTLAPNVETTPSVQQRIQLARMRSNAMQNSGAMQQQLVTSPVRAATTTTGAPVTAQASTQAATQASTQAPVATDESGLF